MCASSPLSIWCVLDSKPGHKNLARGMVAALAAVTRVTVTEISAGFWHGALGKCMQSLWPLGTGLVSAPPDAPRPDLVLGSGGNVLWFTAALARRQRAPAVFVGSRRRLPPSAATFLHYDPDLAAEGTLCLPVLPGPFGRADQEKSWAAFARDLRLTPGRVHHTALIGGDGSGFFWTETDAEQLAAFMNALSAATGRTWLITTSRRTPAAFEARLIALLTPSIIADACWFHRGDTRRVVAAYLGGADSVFVGEDSMSMIHEAITSGQPVVTLRPAQARPDSVFTHYLDHAAAQKWILRHPLSRVATGPVENLLSTACGYQGDALVNTGRIVLDHLRSRGLLAA